MEYIKTKQYWNGVEELYKDKSGYLINYARQHIYSKDYAIDMVHNALARAQKYLNEHPGRKLREHWIKILILKECTKWNKYSKEVVYTYDEEKN